MAVSDVEKAVAIHEQTYGEDHVETARLLTDLGCIHRAQGNHAEAQKILRRALRIAKTVAGMTRPKPSAICITWRDPWRIRATSMARLNSTNAPSP